MAMQGHQIAPLAWDGMAWVEGVMPQPDTMEKSFRLATMNILTDTFPAVVQMAISSHRRFEQLLVEIERLDATVLGLNEVSRTSLKSLLASDFVRRNYYVSESVTNTNGTLTAPHGCVLFSKIPFDSLYAIDPLATNSNSRKPVVGVVRWAGIAVSVCSLHTVAYQTAHNMKVRAKQIHGTAEFLKSLNTEAHFIVGDLNMHCEAEDAVLVDSQMLDLWAETHFKTGDDGNCGYTFDPSTNSMIPRYIPGEARKMRLDRILCFKKDMMMPASSCAIWGHDPVDASAELFLSDHYGLFVDLIPAAHGLQGDEDVLAMLQANAHKKFEEYNISRVRFSVALFFHSWWLLFRMLGLK
jgi:hypothetical protein